MDIALCTINNINYDISSFNKLGRDSLNIKRRALMCIQCNGKGFYRKKSSDGKPACFGAYHEDNCKYKSKDSAPRYDPQTVEDVNSIVTNNETININFTTYTEAQLKTAVSTRPASHSRSSSATSKHHSRHPVQHRNISKGLRSLLRMLMYSDSFKDSDIDINTGAKHPFKAKNLFVNFDEITDKHVEKWRGYWGIISDSDTDIHWLNTANKNSVSIPVSEYKSYITDVFNLLSSEDLAGAAVLVFGRLEISKSDNKKWYIKINNNRPDHIFIHPKK